MSSPVNRPRASVSRVFTDSVISVAVVGLVITLAALAAGAYVLRRGADPRTVAGHRLFVNVSLMVVAVQVAAATVLALQLALTDGPGWVTVAALTTGVLLDAACLTGADALRRRDE